MRRKTYTFLNDVRDGLMKLSPHLTLRIDRMYMQRIDWSGQVNYPVDILLVVLETAGGDGFRNLSGAGRCEFQAGHAYFMPPDNTLAFTLSLGTRFVAFQFNLELFSGFDLFSGLHDCVDIEDHAFAKRIDTLFQGKDDFELLCLAKGELYAFAGRLGLRSPEEIKRLMLGGHEYAPLFALLNDGLDARTPVSALAAAMKLSPEQLSRRFHRDFGMTVKTCMSRRLLRQAMAKLAQPGMTARRTARDLKFSSEFYFSRFFKQHAGLSPRQFKQQFSQPGR